MRGDHWGDARGGQKKFHLTKHKKGLARGKRIGDANKCVTRGGTAFNKRERKRERIASNKGTGADLKKKTEAGIPQGRVGKNGASRRKR